MYNMLTENLPTKYKGYHINTDFKCGIKISLALDDWQLGDDERVLTALSLLYGEGIPDDMNIALDGLRWFLTCGKEADKASYSDIDDVDNAKESVNVKGDDISFDFEVDASNIYAAFLKNYNIDLTKTDMHWFQFIALFSNLKNTSLNDMMYYRTLDLSQYKGEQKAEMKALKERYKIHKITKQQVENLKVIYGEDWVKHI